MATSEAAALNEQLGIMDPNADISGKIKASTAAGFAIATIAIILRFFCRWVCRKSFMLNDYLILAAYPFKLAIDVASICLINYGIGKHITALTPQDVKQYLQVLYVGSFVYAPCIGFAKLSVLALYWSAFPGARYLRQAITVTASFVAAWAFACCLVGMMACLPIHAAWDVALQSAGRARCIDYNKYYYGLQIPNILSDVIILALPWKAVYDMSKSQGLAMRQTIALFGIFSLGIVTVVFDIIRLVVLLQTPTTLDFSWNQVPASIWTDIEPSVAILVACMPVMRPLLNLPTFMRRRRAIIATTAGNSYDGYGQNDNGNAGGHRPVETNEGIMLADMSPFHNATAESKAPEATSTPFANH